MDLTRFRRFIATLARNPKTSSIAIASLVAAGYAIAHDPGTLSRPEIYAAILSGLGFLLAADGDKAD